MVIERGASGPKPNSGTVGPKIVMVGVPIADARCWGAESFVTRAMVRPMSSADASSDNRPVASIAAPSVAIGHASRVERPARRRGESHALPKSGEPRDGCAPDRSLREVDGDIALASLAPPSTQLARERPHATEALLGAAFVERHHLAN